MNPALARRKSPRILAASVTTFLGILSGVPHAKADQFWDGPNANNAVIEGGTGIWNAVATNWTNAAGTVNTVYDPAQTAIFGVTAGTVTVGSDLSFTNLRFDVGGYAINGPNKLLPTGTAILNVLTGTTTFNVQMAGTGAITVRGAGVLNLNNAGNVYTGGTTLESGTLFVNADTALGTGTLTITSPSGTAILGSNVVGTIGTGVALANPVSVTGDFSIATNVDAANAGNQNFTLNGPINLNGATRTITGVTNGGQVHFGAGGIGLAADTGGVTFNTTATAIGQYVAFIFDPTNVNKYQGLTTLNNGAFIVLEGDTINGALQGDVLIQGDGVVDYLGHGVGGVPTLASEQIADTATVTVNSGGNALGGGSVVFTGLDFFNSKGTETIGTLNGNANGTVGLGAATLAVGAGDFSGVISDGFHTGILGGKLIKYGLGTLTLRGANTFTGGTTVNDGGTLRVTETGSLASRVVLNSGTLDNAGSIVGGAAGVAAVNVPGLVAGTNVIVNLGTITGTGGTAIDATGTAPSVAAVAVTNAGTINGDVKLSKFNDVLTVATRSTINGTITSGGGLDALRLVGGGVDTVNLGKFANFNTVTKLGGGTWTVTGTGSFPGGTTVSGGEFLVDGNLVSNVLVTSAGTLGGHGLITGNLINTGTVSIGGALGTLSVKGKYSQQSGGTLVIRVNGSAAGQHDALVVDGAAELGGTLQIKKGSGVARLKPGDQIPFLTATGGVSGKFSQVTNPFTNDTIVSGEVVYGADSVVLEAVQSSYVEFGNFFKLTPNQLSVGGMLDSVANDPRARSLNQYLTSLPLDQIPGALTKISPEALASAFRLGGAQAYVQGQNVQRRTADLRSGSSGFSASGFQAVGSGPGAIGGQGSAGVTGPAGPGSEHIAPPPPDKRWGTFVTGVGEFVHVGDTENARGYDLDTGGFTMGVDCKLTPNFGLGLSAGYAATSANLASDGRVSAEGVNLGIYATYFTGGLYVDAAVNGGVKNYETQRSALRGDARGKTDGEEVDLLFGTGYFWKMHGLTFGPTATFQYTNVGLNGFTERGSLAPLEFGSQSAESIRSTLGFKVSFDWKLGDAIVRPELSAAWKHEYGPRSFAIDSRLASGAGGLFTVNDTEVGRDSLLLSGGVAVLWTPRTSTYLYYDGELARKEYDSQNVSGGVRVSF